VTSEMTYRSYQAVRCLYCSDPIPLSVTLLKLYVVESAETTAERPCQSQVFTLRCESCSRESAYLKSEIESFEGEPPKAGQANRSGARRYPKSLRKAAGQ
jgi:hypothetical protein